MILHLNHQQPLSGNNNFKTEDDFGMPLALLAVSELTDKEYREISKEQKIS